MQKEALGKCPICQGNITISKITCNNCHTTIEGEFDLCKFCKLTSEQKSFIDVFIKCRGNIKEVEKELKVSYPTVKNRLEDVANALGHESDSSILTKNNKKKEILDKLNNGEITFDEALKLMNE
jgi:hypothetical protein